MIEPLRIRFEVECSAEHAFAVWTQRSSSWWPPNHTVSADPDVQVVFEPRPGGRIYERTGFGREIDWGEITVWEPPRKLAYLWHIRVDRSDATEVEITFGSDGSGRTTVEIEHRGWERLGARGSSWRQANQAGWNGVLPDFIAECGRPAA